MRIASAFALCTLSIAFAQTVKLRNVSHSGTQFEAGNIVEVAITGAVPSGTVTVIQNGGAPFVFGTTDSSGNWSITATESGSDVGSYSQSWFVDNVPMTPGRQQPVSALSASAPELYCICELHRNQ